jgi:hypothetical protein
MKKTEYLWGEHVREELKDILAAVDQAALPPDFEAALGSLWDKELSRFHVQETYVLDYKETVPSKFSDSYGSGIVRLVLALYNSFGAL